MHRGWRRSDTEDVPERKWIMGRYLSEFSISTDPCPMFRTRDNYYWVVRISRIDGMPTMERADEPPSVWRFI